MMTTLLKRLAPAAFFALVVFGGAREASAQYRNTQFQILAGLNILFPSGDTLYYRDSALVDPPTGNPLQATLPDGRRYAKGTPYSTFNPMLAFDFLFKVSLDRWWIRAGAQVGLVSTVRDLTFDARANGNTGVWLEFSSAPRFYFLTDKFRPFAEIGLRLSSIIGANDLIPTKLKVFPGIFATIGIEVIVARDIALSLQGRYTRYLTINWPGFNGVEALTGVNLYF